MARDGVTVDVVFDCGTKERVYEQALEAVVADIVEGVRGALVKHDVTFDEYRQGIACIMKTVDQHELPLLIDVFLNTTICQIENRNFRGSLSTLEGPYFLDGAPFVDGALKTYKDDRHAPLLLRGKVTDEFGARIAGAVVDVWHSTPDGHYGGFHNDIPRDFYHGAASAVFPPVGKYDTTTARPSRPPSRDHRALSGSPAWIIRVCAFCSSFTAASP
jgi:chlorocatechol 1,2-dioxygenase